MSSLNITNKNLTFLYKDKLLSFDMSDNYKQYNIKILEKIKSNIFYKVFKLKTSQKDVKLLPRFEKPMNKSEKIQHFNKESLYEKIQRKEQKSPLNFSFLKQKYKKQTDVNL